jgi:hypothetical protein
MISTVLNGMLVCFLCLSPCLGEYAFADDAEVFRERFHAWETWYVQTITEELYFEMSLVDKNTMVKYEVYQNGKGATAMQCARKSGGKTAHSVKLINDKYCCELKSETSNEWLMTRLQTPDSKLFDYYALDVADSVRSRIGSAIYYLQVPKVIKKVTALNSESTSFRIELNVEAFPTTQAYMTLPDLAFITFDSEGLPLDVRYHFTNGDFNFAVISTYETTDGKIRKRNFREFVRFDQLSDELKSGGSEFLMSNYRLPEKGEHDRLWLPYYGLPEPIERSGGWWLSALAVAVGALCVAGAVYAYKKTR